MWAGRPHSLNAALCERRCNCDRALAPHIGIDAHRAPLQARAVGAADFVQIGEVLKASGGLLGADEVCFAEIKGAEIAFDRDNTETTT